jgi:hypothetical protein
MKISQLFEWKKWNVVKVNLKLNHLSVTKTQKIQKKMSVNFLHVLTIY